MGGQMEKEAYVTLVTTTKYLIGAEVLAKSLRALAASRPLVALVDVSLPVSVLARASLSPYPGARVDLPEEWRFL